MPSMMTTCAAHQVRPEAHAVVCICSRHSLISHRFWKSQKKMLAALSASAMVFLFSGFPFFKVQIKPDVLRLRQCP